MQRDENWIRQLAEGCSISVDEVQSEWDDVASDTFVSTSLAAGTLDEQGALEYIMSAVHSRFTSLDPADAYNLIVVGFSGARKPRSGGEEYAELYALFPELDRTPKIRRIQIVGNVEVYKDMTFDPPMYFEGVRLVQYPDGGFKADRRANFDNGVLTDPSDDYLAFIPHIKIAEVPRNLAKRLKGQGTSSWEDVTDWRAVRGIVVMGTSRGGETPDGREWGNFELNDNSMMSPIQIEHNIFLTPALTCWCPRELVPTDESIVTAYGTLSKNAPPKDGSRPGGYSMNVKMVKVHLRREVSE